MAVTTVEVDIATLMTQTVIGARTMFDGSKGSLRSGNGLLVPTLVRLEINENLLPPPHTCSLSSSPTSLDTQLSGSGSGAGSVGDPPDWSGRDIVLFVVTCVCFNVVCLMSSV
jgi:hypothetical protein